MSHSQRFWMVVVVGSHLAAVGLPCGRSAAAEGKASLPASRRATKACKVLTDKRLAKPVKAIAAEYSRLTGTPVKVELVGPGRVDAAAAGGRCHVVVCMPAGGAKGKTSVSRLDSAGRIAWEHPSGVPVWAAPLGKHPHAAGFVRFAGGPTGHRLWAGANFRIAPGKTSAEVYNWIVENRIKHTYPLTAMRILREIGPIREGVCIDIGCGSGILDIELAKRSKFKIFGLDIDPNVKPLFDKRISAAGMAGRISFVPGDAQKLPFADDYADVIVSRGTLTFIPDIKKCLREVHRVLKPTGVAFLGGRYVYTPAKYKISTDKLRGLVADSGVPGAKVIDARGQWVKIVGAKAPPAARAEQGGPRVLAHRFIADYWITKGACLLICKSDGPLERGLQQGFIDVTDLKITAVYPSEKVAQQAQKRIRDAKLDGRITATTGTIDRLAFDDDSFDVIAGVGPILIWRKDRPKVMREIHRILRPGGAALIGGRYLHMPKHRRVASDELRKSAAAAGISSIRVIDDMGQWVEIRKGVGPE